MPDRDRPTDERLKQIADGTYTIVGEYEFALLAAECIENRRKAKYIVEYVKETDAHQAHLGAQIEALEKQLAAADVLRKAAEGEHSLSIECAAYDAERTKVEEPDVTTKPNREE